MQAAQLLQIASDCSASHKAATDNDKVTNIRADFHVSNNARKTYGISAASCASSKQLKGSDTMTLL